MSPVESEKDVVSLVMKCSYLSSNELRIVWEERSKHTTNRMAQSCCKIVEDYFRYVFCGLLPFSLKQKQ